jgi:hypothetical protein
VSINLRYPSHWLLPTARTSNLLLAGLACPFPSSFSWRLSRKQLPSSGPPVAEFEKAITVTQPKTAILTRRIHHQRDRAFSRLLANATDLTGGYSELTTTPIQSAGFCGARSSVPGVRRPPGNPIHCWVPSWLGKREMRMTTSLLKRGHRYLPLVAL